MSTQNFGLRVPVAAFALAAAFANPSAASAGACTHPDLSEAFGLLGDVNGSGAVNVADALCTVIGVLVFQADPVAPAWPACLGGSHLLADIDCNGVITVADVQLVRDLALGFGLPLPVDVDQDGCPDACVACDLESACLIEDNCVPEGTASSEQECQVCDPAQRTDAYSAAPDGTGCSEGRLCTGGACEVSTPLAPTLEALALLHSGVIASFAPPEADGGSPILSYTLLCTGPGGPFSTTGAASPLSLSGMQSGNAYTCVVYATNALGDGAESDPSGGVLASCDDGIQNGDEAGIDCGGSTCDPCFTCDGFADAGPDQNLAPDETSTTLSAGPVGVAGEWSLEVGQGSFADATDPQSAISGLGLGLNVARWTVTEGVCAGSFAEVALIRPIVCEGSPLVSTQADILTLRVCRVITGNLTVQGISGLASFGWLVNLEEIHGNLHVQANGALTSMLGLHNLHLVGGGVTLVSNNALATLDGLDGLTTIQGGLTVRSNAALSSLGGLSALEQVGTEAGDHLTLRTNFGLASAHLPALQTVSGRLWVVQNAALQSVSAPSLVSTGSDVQVEGNEQLDTLELPSLAEVGRDLVVAANASLPQCDALDLEAQVLPNIAGARVIQDNLEDPGCDPSVVASPDCNRDFWVYSKIDRDRLALCAAVGGSVSVHTQESLPAFRPGTLAGLEGLMSIAGDLTIVSSPELVDLDGLEGLTAVGGDLAIGGEPALTDVSALNQLETVGGDLLVQTNANLSLAPSDFASLVSVGGDLIWHSNHGQLVGTVVLNAFPVLQSVGQGLTIEGNALHELRGFGALLEVGSAIPQAGVLSVRSNGPLQLIDAFANLQAVPHTLRVEANPNLQSVASFPALESVGNLWLVNNASLPTLGGFDALTSVLGELNISQNSALHTLSGFSSLEILGTNLATHTLRISTNSALSSVTAFAALEEVASDVRIQGNAALTSLASLAALERVGRHLRVENNDALSTLGLDGLGMTAGSGVGQDFYFADNAALPQCDVYDLRDQVIAGPGSLDPARVTIFQNAADASCPDLVPPVANCASSHFIGTGAAALALQGCTATGNLTITSTTLTGLTGLENIETVDGFLTIQNSPALTSLAAMQSLKTVTGNVTITNNGALTDLGSGSLETIGGFLRIHNLAALPSLTGLEALESVDGYLRVSSANALTSIAALGSLSSIGSYLEILSLAELVSLQGLEGLTTIPGYLNIQFCPALTNLEGLDNVTSITGYVLLLLNAGLVSLDGLELLQSVGGYLEIRQNAQLSSLLGLSGLQTIGGTLRLQNLAALQTLTGLDALTTVGQDLLIQSGPALQSLTGLEALTTVGGWLRIQTHANLQSLAGLSGLQSVSGFFRIENNGALSALGVDSLTQVGGDFIIFGNASLPQCLALALANDPGLTIGGVTSIDNNDANATCD